MLLPFILLFDRIIMLYEWVLIAYIAMHWLIYFKILNPYQKVVRKLNEILNRLVEPVLMRLRKIIPAVPMVDLSPIALFLLLYFIRDMLYAFATRG